MSLNTPTAAYPPPRTAWDRINPVRMIGELSETRYWMYLLLLPSALLITAVVLYPTIYGMQLSFREMRLNRPELGTGRPVPLRVFLGQHRAPSQNSAAPSRSDVHRNCSCVPCLTMWSNFPGISHEHKGVQGDEPALALVASDGRLPGWGASFAAAQIGFSWTAMTGSMNDRVIGVRP